MKKMVALKMLPSILISPKLLIRCLTLNCYAKYWRSASDDASLRSYSKTIRKQFVRVENVCSQMRGVSSGVLKGSVLEALLFCIFINDLFSETYLFADDLNVLSIHRTPAQIQRELHSIENWVSSNEMQFALDECAKVTLRGDDHSFNLFGAVLNSEN